MRALMIVHQSDAGPGVFLDVIRSASIEFDVWNPSEQSGRPADAGAYGAILTFGGDAHPTQDVDFPWLRTEKALLREALKAGTPMFGVCLGAQLIAEAAGTRTRPAAVPEIGWYDVKLTGAAKSDPLFGDLPDGPRFEALEWHTYEIPLPPGATALANSDGCLQAYRIGARAWGVQSHPEVTAEDFNAWVRTGASDPSWATLDIDADDLSSETDEKLTAWQELGRLLVGRFLKFAAARSGADAPAAER